MELMLFRISHRLYSWGFKPASRALDLINRLVLGAHVPGSCDIGRGTQLAYGGSGVVLHKDAVLGKDCVISPGVVVGGRGGHQRVPVIGDRVKLWPGAKVLGPIRIGDDCEIGANAVVVGDLAPGSIVVSPTAQFLRNKLNRDTAN